MLIIGDIRNKNKKNKRTKKNIKRGKKTCLFIYFFIIIIIMYRNFCFCSCFFCSLFIKLVYIIYERLQFWVNEKNVVSYKV